MKNLIDLSHTIEDGLVTYKGLPAPAICDYLSWEASKAHYGEGVSFQIGKIEMVANTGTYIDSPFHRYADGNDLSELSLSSMAGLEGIMFRMDSTRIGHDIFGDKDLRKKAVLIHTNWSRHWITEQYYENHPFLTKDAAVHLREAGASLAGIDSYNIDDTSDGTRPVHSVLLAAGIPIVEHMCNLHLVPDADFKFYAVPAKVKGFGTFPVRAFAEIETEPANPPSP
ncbi:MAG TPA: cyclase family protein [Desulfobacterales bacterium]|nr:cyclase family protein [Desulfobacterales bacterium]